MNELLQKLVESELLTEDSKNELTEALQATLNEAVEAAKQETEIKVRAELTEAFVTEKEALVEAIDTKVEDYLARHMEELNEDISAFRDLEAEYAQRLVEERSAIAETVKSDMAELIEQLDAFTEKCLEEEFAELEESIAEVKKYQFGKEIYEAVAKTFETKFADTNETLNQLKEAQEELASTKKALNEAAKKFNAVQRQSKMNEVLEPLSGLSREIMETILKTAPTDKLEETYDKFIGRVLHEAVTKSEKESDTAPVLAESKNEQIDENETVVVTGDKLTESINENKESRKLSAETVNRLKKLAGND